jgi:hypothetical protein
MSRVRADAWGCFLGLLNWYRPSCWYHGPQKEETMSELEKVARWQTAGDRRSAAVRVKRGYGNNDVEVELVEWPPPPYERPAAPSRVLIFRPYDDPADPDRAVAEALDRWGRGDFEPYYLTHRMWVRWADKDAEVAALKEKWKQYGPEVTEGRPNLGRDQEPTTGPLYVVFKFKAGDAIPADLPGDPWAGD